ncbi:MAG: HD domain-containing protein [Clostridia bacterium]|nr:HD domain-containing protein [Clostridia bacterium]
MDRINVRTLKNMVGEKTDSFFMISNVEIKKGSTGKDYLDLLLADETGEISGKKWSVDEPDRKLKRTDIVKVRFEVTEFNGQAQLRIERVRIASKEDNLDVTEFVKHAPETSEDMFNEIKKTAEEIEDSDLRNVALKVLSANEEKLMYYPAAKKNHHAIFGGLLYHTLRMLRLGKKVCEVYTNLRPDWVACGVIIHDMEKINEIVSDEYGMASDYSFEGKLLGHIVMGVKSIDRICLDLGVCDEKRIMLDHMVLSHHYEAEYGSPRKPLFPEAEVLHYLDMLDAKMYDFKEAYDEALPGGYSDRKWTLDNREIYHDTL